MCKHTHTHTYRLEDMFCAGDEHKVTRICHRGYVCVCACVVVGFSVNALVFVLGYNMAHGSRMMFDLAMPWRCWIMIYLLILVFISVKCNANGVEAGWIEFTTIIYHIIEIKQYILASLFAPN